MNPVLLKPEADTRSPGGRARRGRPRALAPALARAAAAPLARRARVAARTAGRLRRGRDRGRRQPGRDQPARRRHRQHGGGAGRRRAGAAVLRHRPRRRVRAPARHLALPDDRRSASCSRASCSTASAAMRRCSRRGRSGSRSGPACRPSASSRGSTCRCPRRTAWRCRAAAGEGADRRSCAYPRIANLDEFAPLGAAVRCGAHARRDRRPPPRSSSPAPRTRWPTSTGCARPAWPVRSRGMPQARRAGARHLRRTADARPDRARSARHRGRRRGARTRPARPRDRAAGGQDDAARARDRQRDGGAASTATRSTTARPRPAPRRLRR